jgi:hypothetical protein
MMRLFIILPAVLACFAGNTQNVTHYHNKIDDINNIQQIRPIFNQLIGKSSNRYFINDTFAFSDSLAHPGAYIPPNTKRAFKNLQSKIHAPAWAKADFDGNGYTDILITGYSDDPFAVCIMDSGNNSFFLRWITRRSFQNTVLPLVTAIEGMPAIMYYHYPNNANYSDDTTQIDCDTLVYKFGDFVEYCGKPETHDISKIEYSTSLCFGSCPSFTLTINNKKAGVLNAKQFNTDEHNHEMKGFYDVIIDEASYTEIINLLNYTGFARLADNYRVNWTDDQTCTLKITYDNGKVKTISDYGLLGSFGLGNLYKKLFNIRFNQNWQQVSR